MSLNQEANKLDCIQGDRPEPFVGPLPSARREQEIEPDAKSASGVSRRSQLTKAAVIAAALIAVGGATFYGHQWWTVGRFQVSTDDAYVGARYAILSPKISGYVASVSVEDNAHVKAGDVIARMDDGDYRLAVQNAQDQVAIQLAVIERLGRQVAAQVAGVGQAKAGLASAEAEAHRAALELKRQQELATRQVNTRASLEQAQAAKEKADAAVQNANATIEAADAGVATLQAQQEEARRTLRQYQTALTKAERDLSFTVIRAPFDGVVGNRAMQVGDFVQPAQRLASLVPLDAVYIDANFKETQVGKLQPGQPVSVSVDALPDRNIQGVVTSFAPASGSVFSLLPPDNATGNFTKVVQRLPVRILLPASVTDDSVLRPGMSVVVTVDTRPGAKPTGERLSKANIPAPLMR